MIMNSKYYYWGLQLLHEHVDICYQRNIYLSQPTIDISDSSSLFGQWDEKNRTMSISKIIIENQHWTVVLENLKHEMAHQYVSEYFQVQA